MDNEPCFLVISIPNIGFVVDIETTTLDAPRELRAAAEKIEAINRKHFGDIVDLT